MAERSQRCIRQCPRRHRRATLDAAVREGRRWPARCQRRRRLARRSEGLSLAELLLVVSLLGWTALLSLQQEARSLARERVESATRHLAQGLEQARTAAGRSGSPCVLELGERGWQAPVQPQLIPCPLPRLWQGEGIDPEAIRLEHNLPPQVRFTSNGLVLDGGTVIISAADSELVRCLVLSLPLGVVRLGRWQQESCQVDPTL